jgi:glycogen debranching enzyme
MCPNGVSLLDDKVKRRFPADDTWVEWDHARAFAYESSVAELVQEIVQRHAGGIEFREYNVSRGRELPGGQGNGGGGGGGGGRGS